MKRNFDTKLLDLNGQHFEDGADLKSVAVLALTNILDSDRTADGPAKLALFTLAQKVNKGGLLEVTAEEVALLKDRIGRSFGVIVVGRCYELLEAE